MKLIDGLYCIFDPAGENIYPARDERDATTLVNMMNAAYERGKWESIK